MQRAPHFEGCEIVEQLQAGPVTVVYLARQQLLGRAVIVKALSPSVLPSSPFASIVEREARLLADLHHPAIVRIFDFVRRDDQMWLVLEHVDGWDLEQLLGRVRRLPQESVATIGFELARALEHAHAMGIVHRDLRPKNVLISRQGEVKLTNFSAAVDERLPTAPELLDGSTGLTAPGYMSPEQILGEAAHPRSDLFSLGVLLYECLCGERPFDGPDERTTTQRIRHSPPPPLARRAPKVSSALARVVHRCLEKLPSDRFDSAAELVQALAAVLAELRDSLPQAGLTRLLSDVGLVKAAPTGLIEPPSAGLGSRPARPASFLPGLLLSSVLVLAGGGTIHYLAAKRDAGAAGRGESLELVPQGAAQLRVVAEPWAHVIVDGQRVDTTPFAYAIPLKPGTHYVRLEHPKAPTERRTISLAPGESKLLDVKMAVPSEPPPQPPVAPSPDAGGPAE